MSLLPLQDFGFTLFWCFMWLVASAEWASGQYRMLSALQGEAVSPRVTDCALPLVNFPEALTLLQSNIAVVSWPLHYFMHCVLEHVPDTRSARTGLACFYLPEMYYR